MTPEQARQRYRELLDELVALDATIGPQDGLADRPADVRRGHTKKLARRHKLEAQMKQQRRIWRDR